MAEDEHKQHLDNKLMEYFNVVENLFICQQELNDYLGDGFLNLSKARYSMGVKAVSATQFDGRETTATAQVILQDGDDSSEVFTFVRNSLGEIKNDDGNSVKKRHVTKEPVEDFDDMDFINREIQKMGLGSLDGMESKSKPKQANQDPLKWFGVLVPQSLRAAQKDFQKATQLLVEMANLRQKLLLIKTSLQCQETS